MNFQHLALILCIFLFACSSPDKKVDQAPENLSSSLYLDYSGREDAFSGGVRMIPIQTTSGEFKVWTKRIGNNPDTKVLLLHGGPGATHEYFMSCNSYFPKAGIEYYYYDQLESAYSDQPNDSTLWSLDRYVDEVEQVRKTLGLDQSNFYLLGSSWGGILCMEYALKYQENLKGMIISNMMSSVPDYNTYADEVLGPQLPPEVLKEVKQLEANNEFDNPRYTELLFEHFYTEHILRMPLDQWPNPVNRAFDHMNQGLYIYMQGPSEFGISEEAALRDWDVSDKLSSITVPTLTVGGAHDTMDPKHMEWMAEQMPKGRYLHCANGSHLSMYDDQETYFSGIIQFIEDIEQGGFK